MSNNKNFGVVDIFCCPDQQIQYYQGDKNCWIQKNVLDNKKNRQLPQRQCQNMTNHGQFITANNKVRGWSQNGQLTTKMIKKQASHDVYLRFWSNRLCGYKKNAPFFNQNRITTLHFKMHILSVTDKPLFLLQLS